MRKIICLILSFTFFIISCSSLSSCDSSQISSVTETENTFETESYEEALKELESQHIVKLAEAKSLYDSSYQDWLQSHRKLELDLEMLSLEVSMCKNNYESQINSLYSYGRSKAKAEAEKAGAAAYSKAMAQASGYGSSYATLAKEQAYNAKYDAVWSSYEIQIASLQREYDREYKSIKSQHDAQASLVRSSQTIGDEIAQNYEKNVGSINSWFVLQKQLLEEKYGN